MRAEDPVVEKFDDHSANPVSAAFASMERPQFNITDHIHTERAVRVFLFVIISRVGTRNANTSVLDLYTHPALSSPFA